MASQNRVALLREPDAPAKDAAAAALMASAAAAPTSAAASGPSGANVPADAVGEELVRRKAAEGVKTWRVAQTLEGHTGPVWCLVVVEVRNILISGSSDTTIKIWDIFTFKCRHTLVSCKHERKSSQTKNIVFEVFCVDRKVIWELSTHCW